MSRGRHLYFWGWMAYRDVFPGTPIRLTEYCVELANVTATGEEHTSPSTNFNWTTQPCPVAHNCYDEYCPDYEERIQERPE